MSNDKANAAYHPGDTPGTKKVRDSMRRFNKAAEAAGRPERFDPDFHSAAPSRGFQDQGWGDPRNMGEHPPLTAEEALARRSASGSRYDQPTGQEATPGDWYTALGVFLGGGLVGFLVGVLVF